MTPNPAVAAPARSAATTSHRARILVADDDRNVRAIASIRLSGSGYDVEEAEDGIVALERVKEGGIDVLILDALMPGIDGFEVIKRMAKLENPPSVIFLTSLADDDVRVRGLFGGSVDFLGKPYVPTEFLARVAAAVAKQSVLRRAREEADDEKKDEAPRGTGPHIIEHLIPGMLADMNTASRAMGEADKKDDLEALKLLGHRIKGTAGIFEFTTLSDLGGAIERAAHAANRVAIRDLVEKLARHLEELSKGRSEA
jgi:CheY-like chemotaxis protein/HPt (histidine-containing phosphotransfer) domain-containing protein